MNSYGPFTVALPSPPNVPTTIPNGVDDHAAKIVFMNLSPYTLVINMYDGKNPNKKIMPYVQDLVLAGPQFNGQVSFLAQADLTTIATAPSSALYIETFGPTEPLPGVYPSALPIVSVGGGSLTGIPATSLDSENQPSGTEFIRAVSTPPLWTPSPLQTWHGGNDGSLTLTSPAASRSVQENNLNVVPGGSVTHGHVEMDAAKIATDGVGNVTLVQLKTQLSPMMVTGNQESGVVAAFDSNARSTGVIGAYAPFPVPTQNIPTGITLSGIVHANCGTEAVNAISKTGFIFEATCTASTVTADSQATWTTVGN